MISVLVVTKDEENRYLHSVLTHLRLNGYTNVLVYDDRSKDRTRAIARDCGADVVVRSSHVKSFRENESEFRQASWRAASHIVDPYDWLLVLDADEYIMTEQHVLMNDLSGLAKSSVNVNFHEAWALNRIRVDGYWKGNKIPRLVRYREEADFKPKSMGCQPVPKKAYEDPADWPHVEILHVGYMDPDDRQTKFEFYSKLPSHGHNPSHINSIIGHYKLKSTEEVGLSEWPGVYRGEG